MYPVIIISVIVCVLLMVTVLANPVIKLGKIYIKVFYWMAPLLGALILVISGLLPIRTVWDGMTSSGSINPLKILTLFISMTTLSIYLDEVGFFNFLASASLRIAKADQRKLFCVLFLMVSVLTVFTSNDIIILTFTPFICYFSKKAGIDPMPYLFGEFVAANTWSMMLIIGNPTNIYLASAAGIGFFGYLMQMWLPTLLAGSMAFLLLMLIFKKPLSKPIQLEESKSGIRDKGLVTIGLIHLGLCTVLLVISSYIGLEMWYITLGFAVSLFLCVNIYKKIRRSREHVLLHTLTRAPWELIPFVLSMFVIVLGLEEYQVTGLICSKLGTQALLIKYGAASFLASNVMNNIPMAVAFSSIVGNLQEDLKIPATFACVVGSNIGAYFTPLGALAGIMWSGILNRMGIKFSFKKYVGYGVRISIPVMAAAIFGLYLIELMR